MTHSIVFRPEAEQDLRASYDWYEEQHQGLGDDFLAVVQTALERISNFPRSAPVVHRDVRRVLLKRYPNSVLYVLEVDRVIVLAVYHGRRDPEGWKEG